MSDSTILALDVGERRIGYALANLAAKLPSPGGVLENSEDVHEDIVKLAKDHSAIAVVVGLPRNLSGDDTAQTKQARSFATELKKVIRMPVYLQDEALTSQKAEEELGGRKVGYNKESVDALAATYILADFLRDHPKFPNE